MLRQILLGFGLLTLCIGSNAAVSSVGFLGPAFVAPVEFTTNNSLIASAWQNVTETLDSYLAQDEIIESTCRGLSNITFSINAFSLNDLDLAKTFQYHHTGPEVAASRVGVNRVDADSIYRVGSVSKVFTVYLLLLTLGSKAWNDPITKYIPELARNQTSNLNTVNWQHITLGSLAGQMSGILRETYPYENDYFFSLNAFAKPPTAEQQTEALKHGFPPLSQGEATSIQPCALYTVKNNGSLTCPANDYVKGTAQKPPVFPPETGPAYSNAAYSLLGLVIERVTGKPYADALAAMVTGPLGMTSSGSVRPANTSRAVVPGGNPNTGFGLDFGPPTYAGGIYSTTNDLAKLGLSILNSTLIADVDTRGWLKPITHSASPELSIGRPWEIYRFPDPTSARVVDLYTKAGGIPDFSAYLILSPDHQTGFSILTAGHAIGPAPCNTVLADTLTSIMLPAFEAQARAESEQNFAGTYQAPVNLNSSMILAIDPSGSGLRVTQWISNNTNMLSNTTGLSALLGVDTIRLFPTGLVSESNSTKQINFRAAMTRASALTDDKMSTYKLFVRQGAINPSWAQVDQADYGGYSVDQFVFEVDKKSGRAISISPTALRVTLSKNMNSN